MNKKCLPHDCESGIFFGAFYFYIKNNVKFALVMKHK